MPANRRAQSWDVCVWIRPLTIGYDYLGRARGRRKSARRVNRLLASTFMSIEFAIDLGLSFLLLSMDFIYLQDLANFDWWHWICRWGHCRSMIWVSPVEAVISKSLCFLLFCLSFLLFLFHCWSNYLPASFNIRLVMSCACICVVSLDVEEENHTGCLLLWSATKPYRLPVALECHQTIQVACCFGVPPNHVLAASGPTITSHFCTTSTFIFLSLFSFLAPSLCCCVFLFVVFASYLPRTLSLLLCVSLRCVSVLPVIITCCCFLVAPGTRLRRNADGEMEPTWVVNLWLWTSFNRKFSLIIFLWAWQRIVMPDQLSSVLGWSIRNRRLVSYVINCERQRAKMDSEIFKLCATISTGFTLKWKVIICHARQCSKIVLVVMMLERLWWRNPVVLGFELKPAFFCVSCQAWAPAVDSLFRRCCHCQWRWRSWSPALV